MSNICCVVPSIRPESMANFRRAWNPLFEKHKVTLITVWDGDNPVVEVEDSGAAQSYRDTCGEYGDLICRKTDAVRNLGFIFAARAKCYDYILTLDDDVAPPAGGDPIQEHLGVLNRRVPISWMNTALDSYPRTSLRQAVYEYGGPPRYEYGGPPGDVPHLRGFPYGIRDEAPVMVSHGVWVDVPDFDGRTQLELTDHGKRPQDLPYYLPYFRGPVPKGAMFPMSGMNVMIRKEALPHFYFAPMGPDSGYPNLHRFGDIWCGIFLKRACDVRNWAFYTGASTVLHSRASDAHKNAEVEKLGIEWNEWMWTKPDLWEGPEEFHAYCKSYEDKAWCFKELIEELQGNSETRLTQR
jgi:reversibly glycosylated polypeptide/UDP-arabinopyranose mutase